MVEVKLNFFDLIYVDANNSVSTLFTQKTILTQKMRDVCSQLETSRDVIEASVNSDKADLKAYYKEWIKDEDKRCFRC